MRRYIMNALLALDRFANALLLGSPEETISARAGRWAAHQDRGVKRRIGALVCGFLDAIDPGHCASAARTSHARDDRRARQSIPYRRPSTHAASGNNQ